MTYEITTQPTSEPITLEEARTFLKLTSNTEDAIVAICIKQAREWAEKVTGRALLSQTVAQYWDYWPVQCPILGVRKFLQQHMDVFLLALSPVQSVTNIQYKDDNGAWQTLAASNYATDLVSEPARIMYTESADLPTLGALPNAVKVTYVAGYSATANVPAQIKAAMLQQIAFLYENREDIPINESNNYRVRSADNLLFQRRINLV